MPSGFESSAISQKRTGLANLAGLRLKSDAISAHSSRREIVREFLRSKRAQSDLSLGVNVLIASVGAPSRLRWSSFGESSDYIRDKCFRESGDERPEHDFRVILITASGAIEDTGKIFS
jgi:hypothetical protein